MKINFFAKAQRKNRIIYVWKVLEDLVLNLNNTIKSKENPRLGRTCVLFHLSLVQKHQNSKKLHLLFNVCDQERKKKSGEKK